MVRSSVGKYVVYAISRGDQKGRANSAANPLPARKTSIEFRCQTASPNRIQSIDITLFLATERRVLDDERRFFPAVREGRPRQSGCDFGRRAATGQPANEVPRYGFNRLLALAVNVLHCRPAIEGRAE